MADNNENKVLNVPLLRFPEFTDEWKESVLSDFVERVKRKNKNNLCKLPLTISAQYGLVDQISFFNKVIASENMSNYYLLHKGDFAYNKSYSSEYPWGAIKRLDCYEQGTLSSLYICFKPYSHVSSDFLTHYFETSKWHQGISEIAVEGARNHGLLNVGIQDFFETRHCLPQSLLEQEKIAKFLNLIEERIATQNKIIEKLQSLIKGIAQHCIKESTSGNTYVKLGDICQITTGKLDANAQVDNGIYPFFTCAEQPFKIDSFAFDTEALLISGNGANLGYINYYKGKFNAYQRTYVLDLFSENIQYIKWALKVLLPKRIAIEKSSSNTPYIVLSTLTDLRLPIPCKSKQSFIANLMQSLERKLSNQIAQYDSYNYLKQYLLRQMFI
ncbi:restriction endonuclease subunit S [Parabacteroides sp. 20_3]|uniref:restriction endonuclease subunit S n=1 Tax=Parabacteroides sp. 20_3 TaxID=469591 RepID=UPI001F4173C3|nr:restriction endonuclease subunit S [Parabacteroides sp. 20_3]